MNAKKLKKWMNEMGFRAVDVAAATGVSHDTVKRFLNGRKVMPLNLEAIRLLVETEKKQA